MGDSKFNLPTPQMLIKKAKEETIPVSLRVKESTVAIFDKMAKEAGVNRGAMMNTWLDFYAQNQSSSSEDNSKDIMISYLNSPRFWNTIPSLSAEELIFRLGDLEEFNYLADAVYSYENKKDYDMLYVEMYNSDIDHYISVGIDSNIRFEKSDYQNDELYVTPEQWPLVSVLLTEYDKKYKRLFPGRHYSLTPSVLKKIADECKKYAKLDNLNDAGCLATAIKGHLLDYVEKQGD